MLLRGKGLSGIKRCLTHYLIVTSSEKFAADRDDWSTYRNCDDMYCHCYDKMVTAGVAIKLTTPMWLDKNRCECHEVEAFGRKATHVITHPEMCIVGDEVGGNTDQKGDGHIGGEKYLVERGSVPQTRVSTKDCHFTVVGLTVLTGEHGPRSKPSPASPAPRASSCGVGVRTPSLSASWRSRPPPP